MNSQIFYGDDATQLLRDLIKSTIKLNLVNFSFDQSSKVFLQHVFVVADRVLQELGDSKIVDESGFHDNKETKAHVAIKRHLFKALIVADQWTHSKSLLSRNEDVYEYSNSQLMYLLLPYYIGKLASEFEDPLYHCEALETAQRYFELFVSQLEHLKICRAQDITQVQNLLSNSKPKSLHEERTVRIERHKFQKNLDGILDKLHKNLDLEDKFPENEPCEFREMLLLLLRRFASEIPENLNMLQKELPLAEMWRKQREDSSDEKPSEVVTIFSDVCKQRTEIAKNVFRPSHRLATISLQECANYEMEQMQRTAPKNASSGDEVEGDLTGEKQDRADEKDRAWDDWKDDHPRGSGNTIKNVG